MDGGSGYRGDNAFHFIHRDDEETHQDALAGFANVGLRGGARLAASGWSRGWCRTITYQGDTKEVGVCVTTTSRCAS